MTKRKVAENDKTRCKPVLRIIYQVGRRFILSLNIALLGHVIFGEI